MTTAIALPELATRINAAHRKAETAAKSAVQHALEAGHLLLEAKAQCNHGKWLPWLEENFEGSDRTAQNYMRLAHRRPELEANPQRVADLSYREMVKLLAAPKPDAKQNTSSVWVQEFGEWADDYKKRCVALDDAMEAATNMPVDDEPDDLDMPERAAQIKALHKLMEDSIALQNEGTEHKIFWYFIPLGEYLSTLEAEGRDPQQYCSERGIKTVSCRDAMTLADADPLALSHWIRRAKKSNEEICVEQICEIVRKGRI